MSTAIGTPPSKGPRARHYYSKSAVPPQAVDGASSPSIPVEQRQRSNRNSFKHNQQIQQPAWQDGNPPQDAVSTFDGAGASVSSSNMGVAKAGEEPASSDGVVPSNKAKRGRQRQRANNEAVSSSTLSVTKEARTPPPDTKHISRTVSGPAQAQAPTPARTAYAGPAFHASPAPSSIPMPKFFSKSVPSTTSQSTMQSRLDQESDQSESPPTSDVTPAIPTPPPPSRQEESPLDIFFKADREEKEKRRSASGLLTPNRQLMNMANGPQIVQSEPPRQNDWSSIYGLDQRHHSRHPSDSSGKGLFMMELDGTSADASSRRPISPNRPINTAVATPGFPQPTVPSTGMNKDIQKSLKDRLFSLPQPPTTEPPRHDINRTASVSALDRQTPSPFFRPELVHRSISGPSTPAPQIGSSSSDSFYYGNRNLSPLFIAAKGDSVKRASSLRKEITSSSPISPQGEHPVSESSPSSKVPNRRPPTRDDASAISRKYLDAQIEAVGSMPDLPSRLTALNPPHGSNVNTKNGHPGAVQSIHSPASATPTSLNRVDSGSHRSSSALRQAPAIPEQAPGGISRSHSSPSVDVKSMEDDLRRMLNLNVLGGTAAGVR